jgi:hypothetical protein
MSSFRQIEANCRNARLSTGPLTEEGKTRSRQNALRHGLTAETVITALEDAEDYASFEMAVTADYEAQTAVERELVLRLASLLWRLRRATAIESGLFKIQAKQLLQLRRRQHAHQARQEVIDEMYRGAVTQAQQGNGDPINGSDFASSSSPEDSSDNLTRSYLRLTNLPNYPLDRLSRYEYTLWRQARQTLFSLQALNRNRPRERPKFRGNTPRY